MIEQSEIDPPWLKIAIKEMGISEISGNKSNSRIIEYHSKTSLKATSDEVPWCSSFVNWCLDKSGFLGTNSAAARSWLSWGQRINFPAKGCVVILSRGKNPMQGHVGFFLGIKNDFVSILGGNQSDSVKISNFPISSIIGYRWPRQVVPSVR